MDPINILVALNLFVTVTANLSGAKTGFKSSMIQVVERPKSYLQKIPGNVSAIVLILVILGIFRIGVINVEENTDLFAVRIFGLIIFVIFSWLQIASYKTLGELYTQEIVIKKGHKLVTGGLYKTVRHPQYISQMLSDLGAGLAVMSYLALPVVILIEIPLFILRAKQEDKLLEKHFKEEFTSYKKKSGFIIPFIG